jgi:hypothetical protein
MRLRIIAVALVAGLALAACGSSSKSTGSSSSTTSGGSSGGGSAKGSAFCSKGESLQNKYKSTDFTNKNDVKSAAADFQSLTNEAPAAIKADMQTLSDELQKLVAGDTAALQADQAKVTAASDNISKYLKDACGIDTGATTPTT